MKKIKLLLTMLFCTALLLIPTLCVNAEETREIYYPVGISDYVDLNNISNFAVSESKIFYTKDNSTVICYDKISKTSTTLTTSGEVYNICVEGDYAFIFTSSNTYAFNVSSLTSAVFNYPPSSYKAISVNFKDGKYYFAYIINSATPSFNVWMYNDLNSTASACYSYSENIKSSYSDSIIAFSESLIVLKPIIGSEIYLFNYPTSTLTPIPDESSNPYHAITGFSSSSSIYSMEVIESNGNNCIFLGYNNNTMACQFDGTGLLYKNNSIVLNCMATYNNQLFAYNLNNANIYSYNCDNQLNLSANEMFLAGKGSEEGRFKDVSNITYKSGTLYVTDSGNNRVQVLSSAGIETHTISGSCTEVVIDTNNNYYYAVYNGSNSILYKNNNVYLNPYTGKQVISIDIGIDNTIYMLTLDGQILSYGSNASDAVGLGFVVNEDSKLRINHSLYFASKSEMITTSSVAMASKFAVSVDNNIYEINKSTGIISDTITFDSNVKDFKFNGAYIGNPVFVLQENGTLTRSSFTESQDRDMVLTGFDNYTCFSLDCITGEIQLYNNSISAIEIYDNRLFSPITTMPHYYENLATATGNSAIWKYGEVKANAYVYDYYYYAGNYIKLGSSTKVIILEANEEFAYVAYNQNNSLSFGYVERACLIQTNGKDVQEMAIVESDTPTKLRTTNKNVSVFKYPSIYNSTTIYTFAQGDIITTLGKYTTSIDGLDYYVVKIGNGYGYICSNNVVLSSNISKSIKTNAKIKIFDGSEKVNVYLTGEDGSSILCQLPEGYKINVVDYDKNQKYTHITFIDEDQQEREGYVLTSYIKMDGISSTVITAIVLLTLDIIIAVIVVIFYRHYKKRQKENSIEK